MEICGNGSVTNALQKLDIGRVQFTGACQLPVNVKLTSLLSFPFWGKRLTHNRQVLVCGGTGLIIAARVAALTAICCDFNETS